MNKTLQGAAGQRPRAALAAALGCGLTLALAVVLLPASAGAQTSTRADARTSAERVNGRWAGAIDTSNRAEVSAAYLSQYADNYHVSTGWLGSLLSCLLGQPSAASDQATLESLNYVRSLAGLAPVTFSASMNRQAQYAALMMAANHSLSHTPPQNWLCYTPTGARAALRSNLALAWPRITSGQVIDLYMDDRGSSNVAVGHRRWVLNPFATAMGNGSTSTSNALMVVGPTSRNRPNPRFVSWPSPGYFPRPLEPSGRWSLSSGRRGVDFRHATVRVTHNGKRVALRKYPVVRGYAAQTLVWQLAPGGPRRGKFDVRVTGIRHDGSRRTSSHHYTVRIFTPTG